MRAVTDSNGSVSATGEAVGEAVAEGGLVVSLAVGDEVPA